MSEVYSRAGGSLGEDVWVERRGVDLTSWYTIFHASSVAFKEARRYFKVPVLSLNSQGLTVSQAASRTDKGRPDDQWH